MIGLSLRKSFSRVYAKIMQDTRKHIKGVPTFEDFDSEKDRKSLKAHVAKFQTDKGIHLPRHRFLLVASKL
jgi:hypothetical protein